MSVSALNTWRNVMASSTGVQLKWGPNAVDRYILDPKRIGFMFARHKFAAKMLRDCKHILDVGCGDGMATVMFLSESNADVVGVDMDEELISHAQEHILPAVVQTRPQDGRRLTFYKHDITSGPIGDSWYDGVACLDVIEHIEPAESNYFISQLASMLNDDGIAVIGTPNIYAAQYQSPQSASGHINLFSPDRLREDLSKAFRHVWIFSMSDEVVHLGFDKLAHYLMAVCINPRRGPA